MPHFGNNIARLRGFKRLTQKELAAKLNMRQQDYSKIEQKELIDDDMLEIIANALDFPVELIKSIDNNGHVENVYQQDGNKGNVFNYEFNSVEKIVELYDKLLKEKDDVIKLKDEIIKQKEEIILTYVTGDK